MSFIRGLIERIDAYCTERARDRSPFLMYSSWKMAWTVRRGGYGCRPVQTPAAISMDKDPPPLPPPPPPKLPAAEPLYFPASIQTSASRAQPPAAPVKQAVQQPAQSSAAAAEKKPEVDCPPPFDLLDLPEGMEAMGFDHAAYCARRWFNGKAYAPEDTTAAYDAGFVDTEKFKLKWILRFGTVKARYKHLLARGLGTNDPMNIYNKRAEAIANEKFQTFIGEQRKYYYHGTLDTLAHCNDDKQELHRRFQFQRMDVSVFDATGGVTNPMNDLSASLANFALYAAVATAEIRTDSYNRYQPRHLRCTRTWVQITHIYVYARDSYSFNDRKNVSQYLGHWNRRGVIVALDAAIAELISNLGAKNLPEAEADLLAHERGNDPKRFLPPLPEHLDKPVDIEKELRETEVYYPVRNRDFRSWRQRKGRGGDFLIFSDFERIKLPQPIVLDLGEKQREWSQ